MNETSRRVDTALKQAVRQRNYRRIRDRALSRLSNLYPNEYRLLLEEERERDEKENKAWLDISGRTNASVGIPTAYTAGEIAKRFSNHQQESELE